VSGDGRLCWHEWGLATPEKLAEVDLDDRALWAAANPALGIRLRESTIADERSQMSDETFARERLGMWPKVEIGRAGGAIDMELWAEAGDSESRAEDPVALAVDVTPRGVASIGMAGRRTDGLGHIELLVRREGTGWVVAELVRMRAAMTVCVIVVDSRGPAASLLPAMREAGLTVVTTTAGEYAQACGALLNDIREGQLRHRADAALTAAAENAKTRAVGDAWAWDRRDPAVDITPLVAVTLARFGYAVHAATAPSVYEQRGMVVIG
jgi:phage terminase large subunit-like protein